MNDFATTTAFPRAVDPPKAPPPPVSPPAALPAPMMHELRITAVLPLPADQRAQSRIVASMDPAIEAFTDALKAENPGARVDVQVVRTKQKGGA